MKNLIKIIHGIIWKSFLKISPYGVSTIKSRQTCNQISRQSSNDKIYSSKIADHVKILIGSRMQRITRGHTRASNILVQVIFIENLKHLIFPIMKELSVKYRYSMSKTPQRRLIHLPPMVIKPKQWRPKLLYQLKGTEEVSRGGVIRPLTKKS